ACPELRLVVDHVAKPPISSGEVAEWATWASALKEVAAFPNVCCKLSGLVTEANLTSWRVEDLRPFVEQAVEFFGPGRMMFGSDWPVCLLAASYAQVVDVALELIAGCSDTERHQILAGTSTAVYALT